MAQEIERKYLVSGNPWELYKDVKTTKITQGYFTNSSKHTIRVRTKVDMENKHRALQSKVLVLISPATNLNIQFQTKTLFNY
jgi:CYTH domain-containing protein